MIFQNGRQKGIAMNEKIPSLVELVVPKVKSWAKPLIGTLQKSLLVNCKF